MWSTREPCDGYTFRYRNVSSARVDGGDGGNGFHKRSNGGTEGLSGAGLAGAWLTGQSKTRAARDHVLLAFGIVPSTTRAERGPTARPLRFSLRSSVSPFVSRLR